MRRGQVVTIAMQGDFGKPRPALVVQSDLFNSMHATVTVALMSSELINAPLFRIDVLPSLQNGLTKPCQIQVDKMMTIRREKIGPVVGELADTTMLKVNRAIALWIGLA